jgi:hypothetical protein
MTPLPQQEQGSMAPYAETNNNSHRRQPVPRGQHMPRHPLTRMTGIDRIGLAADSSNAKAPEPKGTLALKTLNGLHTSTEDTERPVNQPKRALVTADACICIWKSVLLVLAWVSASKHVAMLHQYTNCSCITPGSHGLASACNFTAGSKGYEYN